MRVNRVTALIVLYATMILIPLLLLLRLYFGRVESQSMFWAEAAACALYFVLIFMTGYWGFVGYPLRYILPALFAAVTVLSYFRTGVKLPFGTMQLSVAWAATVGAVVLILSVLNGISKAAKAYKGVPVRLSFPLRNGTYYIVEGGDGRKSPLMNYHYTGATHAKINMNKSMRYATDIVKLKYGIFARGLLPISAQDYYIAEENLYSPCDGIVLDTLNIFEDEVPFSGEHPNNAGNRIVIQQYDGINILLGHLQRGSIRVKAGDTVLEGQLIASVGNSGLTEFPHLHIQAMRENEESFLDGESVPILFDYKFLVKNKVKRQKPRKVKYQY